MVDQIMTIVNQQDTRLFLELGQLGPLNDGKRLIPSGHDSKCLLKSSNNKIKMIKPCVKYGYSHIGDNSTQYLKFEEHKFFNIPTTSYYNKTTKQFDAKVETVFSPNSEVVAVYLNGYLLENNWYAFQNGKLSIKEKRQYMAESNLIRVLLKKEQELDPYGYNYESDPDTFLPEDFFNETPLEVYNIVIAEEDEEENIKQAYSNTGVDKKLNKRYNISFSENECEESLYNILFQLWEVSKFKITYIIATENLMVDSCIQQEYRVETYYDCVLEKFPEYSEDETANKYSYSFLCDLEKDVQYIYVQSTGIMISPNVNNLSSLGTGNIILFFKNQLMGEYIGNKKDNIEIKATIKDSVSTYVWNYTLEQIPSVSIVETGNGFVKIKIDQSGYVDVSEIKIEAYYLDLPSKIFTHIFE